MPRKITPIAIRTTDCLREIRERAYRERSDELLGCAELSSLALSEGQLRLPINATFPDPPDIVLCDDQRTIAFEVSRLTWQRLSQVLGEATKNWPGSQVELDHALLENGKARRRKGKTKGERSGDYEAIKTTGERLEGLGTTGDDYLHATTDALQTAIKRKKARLNKYTGSSSSVWAFLIDDGYPGAWSELLRRRDFRREVSDVCRGTGFERIYLFRFSGEHPVRLDQI